MVTRVSARPLLLAGASLIVMAGILEPSTGVAQTTNTITSTVTAIQTITSGNSLSITSTGVIAPTSGAGISIPGSTTIGSVWNDGRITSVNSNAISPGVGVTISGIYNTGTISAASNVVQSASNTRIGTITNSGTLTGGTGLNLDNTTLGVITNSGLITATGSNGPISMSGTTSSAALVNTATGTLTGSSASATAGVLQVFGSLTSLTLLDNAGLMKASSGVKVTGTIGALTNSGTIQGTATSGNAISIASTGRINAFTNTGTILGNITDLRTGGLTINGGAGSVYGSLTGPTVGAAGSIISAGNVTFGGNTALNNNVSSASGAGTVTNTGILRTQRNTTITGAYAQPSSATLMINVESASTYGALNVSGAATLLNGSIVMQAALAGTMVAGAYTLVSGSTVGTDYSGVQVTASGFNVDIATSISGSVKRLLATLTAIAAPTPTPAPAPALSVPGPAPANTIDGSKIFTNTDAAAQGSIVTFAGGTLQPIAPLTLNQVVFDASGGTISTNTVLTLGAASGPGQLVIGGVGQVVVSGALSNTGGVSVSSGSLAVNGALSGPLTIASGGMLQGNGTIQGGSTIGGTLSPGASPGLLTFTAPVTLSPAATFVVEVDGPAPIAYDRVIVNGAGFTAGGRIAPVLRGISGAATNSYTPALGQTFQVVSASGGVAGRFASLVQPAAGLAPGTRFDVIYAPTAISLGVTPSSYADLAAAGLAQSDNQMSVGLALESFRPVAGAQGPALFDALYPLSAAEIGSALDQLSGRIHAETLQADRANRLRFGRAIAARQAGITTSAGGAVDLSTGAHTDVATGSASGPVTNGAWGQLLGGWQDGAGADGVTGGAIVGADRAVSDDLKLGMAIGFLRTDLKAGAGLGKGQIDSYQAAAYASWTPGAIFLDAALGYGVSRYETHRTVAFLGQRASSEADGQDLSGEVTVGTRVHRNGAWMEPHAGLRWDRIERDGYSESGGGSAALRQGDVDHDAVRGSIGARFGATRAYGGTTFEPTALVAWAHDFQDPASASAGLNGARFRVLPQDTGRDAVILSAGVAARMSNRLSAQVGYTGEIRSDSADHGVTAGLRLTF